MMFTVYNGNYVQFMSPSVPVPGQPTVNVTSIIATSVSLSWRVPSDSVVTSYEVMWRALSSGDDDEGSGTSGSITSTSYTIQKLESNTVYSVTVTVTNAAGSTVSQPIIITSMLSSFVTPTIIVAYFYSVPTDSDVTAVVTGGLVTVVVVLIIAVTVIVIVVLLLRNHRRHYSPGIQRLCVNFLNFDFIYISSVQRSNECS